jgi:hypothetical protein
MDIDADLKVCPICQYEFPQQNHAIQWVAILLIIIFLLYFIL